MRTAQVSSLVELRRSSLPLCPPNIVRRQQVDKSIRTGLPNISAITGFFDVVGGVSLYCRVPCDCQIGRSFCRLAF